MPLHTTDPLTADTITASLAGAAWVISPRFGESYSFDQAGRLLALFLDERSYQRTLDHRLLERQRAAQTSAAQTSAAGKARANWRGAEWPAAHAVNCLRMKAPPCWTARSGRCAGWRTPWTGWTYRQRNVTRWQKHWPASAPLAQSD